MQKTVPPRLKRESDSPVAAPRMSRLILTFTLSLLAAHGALAQKVTMQFDQAADFSKYKSFAIATGS